MIVLDAAKPWTTTTPGSPVASPSGVMSITGTPSTSFDVSMRPSSTARIPQIAGAASRIDKATRMTETTLLRLTVGPYRREGLPR